MESISASDGAGRPGRRRRSVRIFGIRIGTRRQVLYNSLSILFSFFINYIFLWPVNHFWALMLLALAVTGLMFNDLSRRSATVGGLVAFAVAGGTYLLVGPAISQDGIDRAWLRPAADATPPNPCTSQISGKLPANMKLALIGNNAVLLRPGETTKLLTVGACKSVALQQDERGVVVNVDDYDTDGAMIFRIVNNQLRVMGGRATYAERTPDHSAVSIHGEDGGEFMRLTYLNPQTLRLSGVFACRGHAPVRITDGAPIPGAPPGACLDGTPINVK